jgi:homoserine O-acetyltransferase
MRGSSRDAIFPLGRFSFACGQTLENAHLAYRVFGELAADGTNLVLMPTSYGAWPEDIDWVVGPILDPERWCVVVVSQFGNGRSSSPSNSPMGLAEGGWCVSHADNVRAQGRLLEEVFKVESPALVYGWSMGAQQGFHWAALEPERCQRLLALCGTGRTTPTPGCSC